MNTSFLIHPQLILTANKHHLGGAIRLFFVAKNMNDYGWVELRELKKECLSLGIKNGSYYKWLKEAKETGLFRYVYSGGKHLAMVTSYKKAYELLEVSFTDAQAVLMPADMLFKKGWLAHVWAASNKTNFQDRVISQETKQRLTGVPVSTQRRLDKKAKIKRTRNISHTEYDATTSNLKTFQHNSNKKGIFVSGGKIAWHIPSQSHVSTSKIQPVGSKRTMRKFGLTFVPEAVSHTPRLFCVTKDEEKSAIENPSSKRDGIYVLSNSGNLGTVNRWMFDAGK